MSSQLPADEQRRLCEKIAAEIVGDGLVYGTGGRGEPPPNECAAGYQEYLARTAEFSQVPVIEIWREAAGYDPVTGIPAVDLVTGVSN